MKKYIITIIFLALAQYSHADCDYSNADKNWGYGWDADTQSSCAPLDSLTGGDFCDYRDAANNKGYGYNAATGESCPPLGQTNYYSALTSSSLAATTGGISKLQQKEAYCATGDIATGGGCAFEPFGTQNTNGWILSGTTPLTNYQTSQSEGWSCSFVCTGEVNTDGTHNDKSCPDTPVSATALCVSNK